MIISGEAELLIRLRALGAKKGSIILLCQRKKKASRLLLIEDGETLTDAKPLWTKGDGQHEDAIDRLSKDRDTKVIQNQKDIVKKGLGNPGFHKAEHEFKKPELLLNIVDDITFQHKKDNRTKLLCFIVCCTAYLAEPKLRMSMALKGDSSVGKDNLIKTVLSRFPMKDWIFLTHATQAVLEDDVKQYRIVACSEINAHREGGANKHLIEKIKQMAEGGISAMKKDLRTGYKTTLHSQDEQKSILYGTTESEDDEELDTRFITDTVEACPEKIKAVNNNTLDWFGGIARDKEPSTWIEEGITNMILSRDKVFFPFLPLLKEKIAGKDVFDNSDQRSMRDVKRLMSIASAIAWLHQKQRKISKKGEIIGEPYDFLAAMIITSECLNRVYEGLADTRLTAVVEFVKEYQKENNVEAVPRIEIQRGLGYKSVNTIKSLVKGCQSKGHLQWKRNENNSPLYQACQKPVKRLLLPVTVEEFIAFFKSEVYINKCKGCHIKPVNLTELQCDLLEKLKNTVLFGKIDTLKLTPFRDNPESPKETKVIHHQCFQCKTTPCSGYNREGNPLCPDCLAIYKANDTRTIHIE